MDGFEDRWRAFRRNDLLERRNLLSVTPDFRNVLVTGERRGRPRLLSQINSDARSPDPIPGEYDLQNASGYLRLRNLDHEVALLTDDSLYAPEAQLFPVVRVYRPMSDPSQSFPDRGRFAGPGRGRNSSAGAGRSLSRSRTQNDLSNPPARESGGPVRIGGNMFRPVSASELLEIRPEPAPRTRSRGPAEEVPNLSQVEREARERRRAERNAAAAASAAAAAPVGTNQRQDGYVSPDTALANQIARRREEAAAQAAAAAPQDNPAPANTGPPPGAPFPRVAQPQGQLPRSPDSGRPLSVREAEIGRAHV